MVWQTFASETSRGDSRALKKKFGTQDPLLIGLAKGEALFLNEKMRPRWKAGANKKAT